MAVHQLGWVAQGVRGNGGHAFVVDHGVGFAAEYDVVAQFAEEGCPEGEVFVHVEDTGDADDAPGGVGTACPVAGGGAFAVCRIGLGCRVFAIGRTGLRVSAGGSRVRYVWIMKQALVFVFIDIRRLVGIFRFAFAPFAAVAGKVTAPVGEGLHGHQAVVAAAVAAVGFGGDGEVGQLFRAEKGGMSAGPCRCCCSRCGSLSRFRVGCFRGFAFRFLQGKDSRPVGAHKAGDIRTDDILP